MQLFLIGSCVDDKIRLQFLQLPDNTAALPVWLF